MVRLFTAFITTAGLLLVSIPLHAQQPATAEARVVPLRQLATDFEVIFAVSDRFDLGLLQEMKAGSYAFAPKGSTMFGSSPDGAIVQVHGVGPFHIHWRHGHKTLDDAEAPGLFRYRKGDVVVGSRGTGTIRQGYRSGTLIQYEVELTNGTLVMESESAVRKADRR